MTYVLKPTASIVHKMRWSYITNEAEMIALCDGRLVTVADSVFRWPRVTCAQCLEVGGRMAKAASS
jgi:hypothetical protein